MWTFAPSFCTWLVFISWIFPLFRLNIIFDCSIGIWVHSEHKLLLFISVDWQDFAFIGLLEGTCSLFWSVRHSDQRIRRWELSCPHLLPQTGTCSQWTQLLHAHLAASSLSYIPEDSISCNTSNRHTAARYWMEWLIIEIAWYWWQWPLGPWCFQWTLCPKCQAMIQFPFSLWTSSKPPLNPFLWLEMALRVFPS